MSEGPLTKHGPGFENKDGEKDVKTAIAASLKTSMETNEARKEPGLVLVILGTKDKKSFDSFAAELKSLHSHCYVDERGSEDNDLWRFLASFHTCEHAPRSTQLLISTSFAIVEGVPVREVVFAGFAEFYNPTYGTPLYLAGDWMQAAVRFGYWSNQRRQDLWPSAKLERYTIVCSTVEAKSTHNLFNWLVYAKVPRPTKLNRFYGHAVRKAREHSEYPVVGWRHGIHTNGLALVSKMNLEPSATGAESDSSDSDVPVAGGKRKKSAIPGTPSKRALAQDFLDLSKKVTELQTGRMPHTTEEAHKVLPAASLKKDVADVIDGKTVYDIGVLSAEGNVCVSRADAVSAMVEVRDAVVKEWEGKVSVVEQKQEALTKRCRELEAREEDVGKKEKYQSTLEQALAHTVARAERLEKTSITLEKVKRLAAGIVVPPAPNTKATPAETTSSSANVPSTFGPAPVPPPPTTSPTAKPDEGSTSGSAPVPPPPTTSPTAKTDEGSTSGPAPVPPPPTTSPTAKPDEGSTSGKAPVPPPPSTSKTSTMPPGSSSSTAKGAKSKFKTTSQKKRKAVADEIDPLEGPSTLMDNLNPDDFEPRSRRRSARQKLVVRLPPTLKHLLGHRYEPETEEEDLEESEEEFKLTGQEEEEDEEEEEVVRKRKGKNSPAKAQRAQRKGTPVKTRKRVISVSKAAPIARGLGNPAKWFPVLGKSQKYAQAQRASAVKGRKLVRLELNAGNKLFEENKAHVKYVENVLRNIRTMAQQEDNYVVHVINVDEEGNVDNKKAAGTFLNAVRISQQMGFEVHQILARRRAGIHGQMTLPTSKGATFTTLGKETFTFLWSDTRGAAKCEALKYGLTASHLSLAGLKMITGRRVLLLDGIVTEAEMLEDRLVEVTTAHLEMNRRLDQHEEYGPLDEVPEQTSGYAFAFLRSILGIKDNCHSWRKRLHDQWQNSQANQSSQETPNDREVHNRCIKDNLHNSQLYYAKLTYCCLMASFFTILHLEIINGILDGTHVQVSPLTPKTISDMLYTYYADNYTSAGAKGNGTPLREAVQEQYRPCMEDLCKQEAKADNVVKEAGATTIDQPIYDSEVAALKERDGMITEHVYYECVNVIANDNPNSKVCYVGDSLITELFECKEEDKDEWQVKEAVQCGIILGAAYKRCKDINVFLFNSRVSGTAITCQLLLSKTECRMQIYNPDLNSTVGKTAFWQLTCVAKEMLKEIQMRKLPLKRVPESKVDVCQQTEYPDMEFSVALSLQNLHRLTLTPRETALPAIPSNEKGARRRLADILLTSSSKDTTWEAEEGDTDSNGGSISTPTD